MEVAEDEILDSITDSMNMNLSKLWEIVEERTGWHAIVHRAQRARHDLVTEQHHPPPPPKHTYKVLELSIKNSRNKK